MKRKTEIVTTRVVIGSFAYAYNVLTGKMTVHRSSWKGKKYLQLVSSPESTFNYIVEISADGGNRKPWLPNQDDILANDWTDAGLNSKFTFANSNQ